MNLGGIPERISREIFEGISTGIQNKGSEKKSEEIEEKKYWINPNIKL